MMYVRNPRRHPAARPGVILLIVLVLLALFSIVGLSFVLYSESEASAARIRREAYAIYDTPPDPTPYANQFLGRMLYPTGDGFTRDALHNHLRGYDMATMVYGNNPYTANAVAYNGLGQAQQTLTNVLPTATGGTVPGIERRDIVNYGLMTPRTAGGAISAAATHAVDPEHLAFRNAANVDKTLGDPTNPLNPTAVTNTGNVYVARNAPYTYPDRNNIYVAVQNPSNGRIILPSYHRPQLFMKQPAAAPPIGWDLDARNPNWRDLPVPNANPALTLEADVAGRYKILRPRPADHILPGETELNSTFPFPPANPDGSITGDVQNITGTNGLPFNDALWMDVGLPVFEWRGRRIKALVAPTILPLDGRVNLNVATGSPLPPPVPLAGMPLSRPDTPPTGFATEPLSTHGFGPWEINLGRALRANASNGAPGYIQGDYANQANQDAFNLMAQRYGGAANPQSPPNSGGVNSYPYNTDPTPHNPMQFTEPRVPTNPPIYARLNWNGRSANSTVMLPTGTQSDPVFTDLTATGYPDPNTTRPPLPPGLEVASHPALFNPYAWAGNRTFLDVDMRRAAVRYSGRKDAYSPPFFANADVNSLRGTHLPPYPGYPVDDPTKLSDPMTMAVPARPAGYNNQWMTPTFPQPAPVMDSPNNPMNAARALVTTRSNSLSISRLMPNFFDYTAATGSLNWSIPTAPPPNPNSAPSGIFTRSVPTVMPTSPTAPVATATPRDFVASNNYQALTQLPAVDLNRFLDDYRDLDQPPNVTGMMPPYARSPQPLASNNMANRVKAVEARQTLARDIFARLILATGATAIVNVNTMSLTLPQPTPGPMGSTTYTLVPEAPLPTAPISVSKVEYDALRSLAQLAANIVDYIDGDDISTPFVWNPYLDLSVPERNYLIGTDTLSHSVGKTTANFDPTNLPQRVVFGVEKPRVLLNEGYSEIAIDPSNNNNVHVRFWLELVNPGNTDPNTLGNQPLGDGTAPLSYNGSHSVYQVQVYRNDPSAMATNNVRETLFNMGLPFAPSNVTGRIDPTLNAADYANLKINATIPTTAGWTLEPNKDANGNDIPPLGTGTGFKLLGPDVSAVSASNTGAEYLPKTATPPYTTKLIAIPGSPPPIGMGTSTTLAYTETNGNYATLVSNSSDHVVLLRRLANPYLPPNDPLESGFNAANPVNPYLTVDVFSDIASQDAVGKDVIGNDRMPPAPGTRHSIGRSAPHYGHRLPTIGAGTSSFTANQTAGVPPTNTPHPTTLLAHNSNFTTPASWLTHFDRPLVNTMDLLHVSRVMPHELTYRFGDSSQPAGSASRYQQHVAPWTSNSAPLYRALELLQTKPWGYGLGHGGRVPGKVNVNMVWDQRVLEAVLDPNTSNGFTQTDVAGLYIDNTTAMTSGLLFGTQTFARTKDTTNGIPGPTTDEGGTDRPFKPFGQASFAASAGSPLALGTNGLEDTLLRTDTNAASPKANLPAIFTNPPAGPNPVHPYARFEMLRKMYNNVTTTTDTYLVVMTVGFFEVRNDPPYTNANPTVLGREMFDEIPGDMRSKFCAIVDRSMLALNPSAAAGAPSQMGDFFTTETTTGGMSINLPAHGGGANPDTFPNPSNMAPANVLPANQQIGIRCQTVNGQAVVMYEGRTIPLNGANVYIGTGNERTVLYGVTVGTPTNDIAYITNVQIPVGATARTVTLPPIGSVVTNAVPANPGSQPTFDAFAQVYRGVVPYFEQIPKE